MTDSITITLPWPDKDLSPNARVHFHALAAAKRQAKSIAHGLALEAGARFLAIARGPVVTWQFSPPDRRRRDLDNCIASCKAYSDGLAMALQVDDSAWEWRFLPMGQPVKGGQVTVTIEDRKEEA